MTALPLISTHTLHMTQGLLSQAQTVLGDCLCTIERKNQIEEEFGLPLGTEAPAMTPNGSKFPFGVVSFFFPFFFLAKE